MSLGGEKKEREKKVYSFIHKASTTTDVYETPLESFSSSLFFFSFYLFDCIRLSFAVQQDGKYVDAATMFLKL